MKFITAILSAFFCLSIQAQLVTYPGTLSTGCRTMMTIPYASHPRRRMERFVRIQRTGRYGQSAGCFHGAI